MSKSAISLPKQLPDSENKLVDDLHNLLQLSRLMVDINLRQQTGQSLDHDNAKGYSVNTIRKRLGSNVSPVEDNGFLGV